MSKAKMGMAGYGHGISQRRLKTPGISRRPERSEILPPLPIPAFWGVFTQGVYSVTLELALQKGNTPYVVNKIRLDFGAFLWSISFLPVMGYLGIKGRSDGLGPTVTVADVLTKSRFGCLVLILRRLFWSYFP